ncbi:cyclase family protein [Nocardioides sp. NPDC051685]|uniref:cyclase family protein n=1 Tax=Nocardioides sp. NPDC051685 TaxID=3364334 RepID=UPI003789B501
MTSELPSPDEVRGYLTELSNWGRWGRDDQRGTINLITARKRVEAAQLVRTGRTVSLGRPLATVPGPRNPQPAVQFWTRSPIRRGGHAGDFLGVQSHGHATTHLDALCHVWDENGIYNGRDPEETIEIGGANFGAIDAWSDGIVTRGVMLDVPRHRGSAFVAQNEPVHGWELEAILVEREIELRPGDALVVNCGREAWQEANPDRPYGHYNNAEGISEAPGLHASCLPFLRKYDVGVLVWDMLDAKPFGYDVTWTIHGAIHAFGLAILDNALTEPLAVACLEQGQDEFMIFVSPLVLERGTSSPVNPIAVF